MSTSTYNLRVNDSLVSPYKGNEDLQGYYQYSEEHNLYWYKVFLYIEGSDMGLEMIQKVKYVLTPGFDKIMTYQVERSSDNPLCVLEFFAWSSFYVEAHVYGLLGERVVLSHNLSFADKIDHIDSIDKYKDMDWKRVY